LRNTARSAGFSPRAMRTFWNLSMNEVRMSSIGSMRQLGGDFGSGGGAGCAVAASELKRDLIRTSLLTRFLFDAIPFAGLAAGLE
jgi:hypothetical protein